jgi:hypothetical protein
MTSKPTWLQLTQNFAVSCEHATKFQASQASRIGRGRAPEQYPDYDEETGEMNWNPDQRP